MIKLDSNFRRSGGLQSNYKTIRGGEVWIFSGTKQCEDGTGKDSFNFTCNTIAKTTDHGKGDGGLILTGYQGVADYNTQ